MQTLETTRLLLRPYDAGDVDFVLDMYSRMEVQRFLGAAPKLMKNLDEAQALIEAWGRVEDGICGVWAVEERDTGKLAGTLLLKPIPASGPERQPSGDIEIGWHFHPASWGQGFAAEAAAAVLEHSFSLGLPRVVVVIDPANTASRRVCEKIGVVPQGNTDRYYNTVLELFTAENPG
ncbi:MULTISPECIES: GNAT family N-acetyltransferase [unclassified Arthrobacter]|uniref:GNAT family N-acetyltransferase n=1 Tax=unclassified Arthrobacter TaxID=235627 RepID=UPI001E5FAA29|nr:MULTISPECIES: GNAT family N-acetyltransferase [unclassified Arthrobacter]MCC9145974.1 GNAT family N-acetyltransferase [Arthrobacter sp. zg-Y919]MDK1277203.1 GNAT family N-acetyltransferase [Arthrobacter sp. zg.Y919]WIB03717.1 GNAT family N-acetyltransferase [Arthrobacter sp. zg-Y919]